MKRELVGHRFGSLMVVEEQGRTRDRFVLWLCRCDCGIEAVFASNRLSSGDAKSCGNHRSEAKLTHGQSRSEPGRKASSTYKAWMSMKARCYQVGGARYKDYGGRGIRVCERWRSNFANFFADMGERPLGYTLDRLDPDGNYEPGNCRWATPTQQST